MNFITIFFMYKLMNDFTKKSPDLLQRISFNLPKIFNPFFIYIYTLKQKS